MLIKASLTPLSLNLFFRSTALALLAAIALLPAAARADFSGLYVADSGTNDVYQVPSSGASPVVVDNLGIPESLAFGPNGNLYVGAAGSAAIFEIQPDGSDFPFVSNITSPQGLAFDASGDLFVSQNSLGNITEIAPNGTASLFATGLGPIHQIAFDNFGNLFVADSQFSVIYEFAPGNSTPTVFTSTVGAPLGLAYDSVSGNLAVSNGGNGEIYSYTPSAVQTVLAGGFTVPFSLAFDPSQNLYVSSFITGNITAITPSGSQSPFAFGFTQPVAIAYAPVPEPATSPLLFALAGLLLSLLPCARRKLKLGWLHD